MKPNDWDKYIIALGVVIPWALLIFFGAKLMLQGCEPNIPVGMTNDEIVAEVKKCNDAGLLGQVVFDRSKRNVIKVQCITRIKESADGPVVSAEA